MEFEIYLISMKTTNAKTYSAVIFVLLALFLLTSGVLKMQESYNISSKAVTVSPEDLRLLKDVTILNPIPLENIQVNMYRLLKLHEMGIGEIQISSSKKKNKDENEKTKGKVKDELKKDRIGHYKDLTIKVKGDIFEQLYVMKVLNKRFQTFLLIKSFKGNKKNLTVEARLYGRA